MVAVPEGYKLVPEGYKPVPEGYKPVPDFEGYKHTRSRIELPGQLKTDDLVLWGFTKRSLEEPFAWSIGEKPSKGLDL